MKRICVGLVFLMCIFLFPTLARADSIATLDLSSSFVPTDSSGAAAIFGNGPSLFVTGQFTLDEDTSVISSWNMSFLGPLGATYQLSAQNRGMATAKLEAATWNFSFGNGTASLDIFTLVLNDPLRPFSAQEVLQLCGAPFTIYPGNVIVGEQRCVTTSGASFDDQDVAIYQLPNGFSSGTLTVSSVASTPEPSESSGLLLGLAALFVCMAFKTRRRADVDLAIEA